MQKNNHTTSTIVIMSIPIFIELLLQLLVGNIDQFMISQYSQDSVAAIGNGNQVMNIAIIVLNAMSLATTVLLAQYLGAQDKRKISQICTVSVLVITVASVIAGALMVGLNQPLFSWMNVPHFVIDDFNSRSLYDHDSHFKKLFFIKRGNDFSYYHERIKYCRECYSY